MHDPTTCVLVGCAHRSPLLCGTAQATQRHAAEFVGTDAPFASNAIYFVMTDRFVNGDPSNDQRDQGGAHRTFDIPVPGAPKGESANIGYLGGDFKGVLDNAAYIRGMGFGAVWITPIVDNPNEAFTGGDPVAGARNSPTAARPASTATGASTSTSSTNTCPARISTSPQFTTAMRAHGLKTVLDIVANHGSPAFSMPKAQPMFGQIYDQHGKLIADEQNLPPYELDPVRNPLHRFYHAYDDLVQLSNIRRPEPGRAGLLRRRVRAVGRPGRRRVPHRHHQPHVHHVLETVRRAHSRETSRLLHVRRSVRLQPRQHRPYTWPQNGGISLLDFPLRGRIADVFEHPGSDYARLLDRCTSPTARTRTRTNWSPSTTTTTWRA